MCSFVAQNTPEKKMQQRNLVWRIFHSLLRRTSPPDHTDWCRLHSCAGFRVRAVCPNPASPDSLHMQRAHCLAWELFGPRLWHRQASLLKHGRPFFRALRGGVPGGRWPDGTCGCKVRRIGSSARAAARRPLLRLYEGATGGVRYTRRSGAHCRYLLLHGTLRLR